MKVPATPDSCSPPPAGRSVAGLRRALAVVVIGAVALGLSACGSGRAVGQDFGEQAAKWPGVIEAYGGGSADLPGGGSATARLTVAADAPEDVVWEQARRSVNFKPSAAGPDHMSSVEIQRGDDLMVVGRTEDVAKARVAAFFALIEKPQLGQVQLGTTPLATGVALSYPGLTLCEVPALYAEVADLKIPDIRGVGLDDIAILDASGGPLIRSREGAPLNPTGLKLWEQWCDASPRLAALRLDGTRVGVQAVLESELPALEDRLRASAWKGITVEVGTSRENMRLLQAAP